MKQTYPIVITEEKATYCVYIPDFDINTEGESLAEAMEMARDGIGIAGIVKEDFNLSLPIPSNFSDIQNKNKNALVTLVDIDFSEYRKMNDLKTVRRNITLQSWLDYAASKAGINVSAICQKALMDELKMYSPKYLIQNP